MAVGGGSGGAAGSIRAGKAHIEMSAKDAGLSKALDRIQRRMMAVAKVAASLTLAFAGVFTAAAIGSFKSAVHHMDELNDAAIRLGTTTEELSALSYAAEQSGSNLEETAAAAKFLQKNLVENADEFAKIGLDAEKLRKMGLEDQFQAVADAINRIQDPAEQTAAAISLMGKGGTQMLPMLKELRQLRGEAGEVGAIVSTEDAKAAARIADAFDRVWTAAKSAFRNFGSLFFLTDEMETLAKFAVLAFGAMRDGMKIVKQEIIDALPHFDTLSQTWDAFRNAVQAGDIGLAIASVTAGVEVAWRETVLTMTAVWNDFKGSIVDGFHEAMTEIVVAMRQFIGKFEEMRNKVLPQGLRDRLGIIDVGGMLKTEEQIRADADKAAQARRDARRRDEEEARRDLKAAQDKLNAAQNLARQANAGNPVLAGAMGMQLAIWNMVLGMKKPGQAIDEALSTSSRGQFGGQLAAQALGVGNVLDKQLKEQKQANKHLKKIEDNVGGAVWE